MTSTRELKGLCIDSGPLFPGGATVRGKCFLGPGGSGPTDVSGVTDALRSTLPGERYSPCRPHYVSTPLP